MCEYSAVLSFMVCSLFVLSTLQILFCLHLIQRMLLYPVKKFLLVHQFHIVVFCLLPQGNTVSKRIVLSPPNVSSPGRWLPSEQTSSFRLSLPLGILSYLLLSVLASCMALIFPVRIFGRSYPSNSLDLQVLSR